MSFYSNNLVEILIFKKGIKIHMKNNKLLINVLFVLLFASVCAIFLLFFKSPEKTAAIKDMQISSGFESIKKYSSDDFSFGNFKQVSYKAEQPEIQKFVSGFISFLDDYEYVPGEKNPEFFKYFTNIDYNVDIFDPNYDHKMFSRSLQLINRYVYTDWWIGAEVKTEKIREIQILSKSENEKVDMLPKPVDKYTVGVIAEVERGSLFDANAKRTQDLRLMEFIIVRQNGQLKIHDLSTITDKKQIDSFLNKFDKSTTNEHITLNSLIKDLKNNTGSTYNSGSKINKYAPTPTDGLTQSINFEKVRNLDDRLIQAIVKDIDEKVVVIANCDENGNIESIGGGFFIKPGIIATNCHVIAGAKKLDIITHQGKKLELDGVIAADGVLDAALLKTKDEVGNPVKLGDANQLKREDALIAIGHPLGITYSVSTGVFDCFTRNNEVEFIKNRLPLSPGNSGGPLINTKGEVVGINTAINQFGDISFAIPVSYFDSVLKSLDRYKFADIKVLKLNQLN
jgi:hypothetical protein